MKCPHCSHPKSSVISTEHRDERTFRRRDCKNCNRRYGTVEISRGQMQLYVQIFEDDAFRIKELFPPDQDRSKTTYNV